MIKFVVFDLDGVLVNAREIHYEALNAALADVDEKYVINKKEHLSIFDGLSTTKKLNLLSERKGLDKNLHNIIWKTKQKKTIEIIDNFSRDERVCKILKKIKSQF